MLYCYTHYELWYKVIISWHDSDKSMFSWYGENTVWLVYDSVIVVLIFYLLVFIIRRCKR